MTASNFESLPNEILTDIIEKYMNGVDVLKAVAFQQNRRFDQLVLQSQRLRFNFFRCHKDDFRLCMGLFPAYMDKIEELALSEDHTPGQVHAFLSFYPSFSLFPRLRTLYFQFDEKATDIALVETAIESLCETNIRNIHIKAFMKENSPLLHEIIIELFSIRSLEKLSITTGLCDRMNWANVSRLQLNIQYLTISGIPCGIEDLEHILRCAPRLKHLNIELRETAATLLKMMPTHSKAAVQLHSPIRSLVLRLLERNLLTINQLQSVFCLMPSLSHLKLKLLDVKIPANEWQTCIEASLPSLTHFTLHLMAYRMQEAEIEGILTSFQNAYWIEKNNFNLILTRHPTISAMTIVEQRRGSYRQSPVNLPVTQCHVAPLRSPNRGLTVIKENLNLFITNSWNNASCTNYFNNVTSVVVDSMDQPTIDWMKNHVNCFQVKRMIITDSNKSRDVLSALLGCVPNIITLDIKSEVLHKQKAKLLRKHGYIRELRVTLEKNEFDSKIQRLIRDIFPHLEHFTINLQLLDVGHTMQEYLPYLRSFTFQYTSSDYRRYQRRLEYERELSEYRLRRKVGFLYALDESTMTVWLDETTFKDPFWKSNV